MVFLAFCIVFIDVASYNSKWREIESTWVQKKYSNEKFTVKKRWDDDAMWYHSCISIWPWKRCKIVWRRNCCTIQIYTDLYRFIQISAFCIWPWKLCNMDWCKAVGLCYNQLPQSEAKCSIKMQLKKVYTKCSKITAGSIKLCNSARGGFLVQCIIKLCNSARGGFLVQCIGLFQCSGFGASSALLCSIAGTSASVWLMDHLM